MVSQPRWQHIGGTGAAVYERHLVPAMFAPWAPKLVDLAEVMPGERILDLACGTGVVTRVAAERVGPVGQVVGLDLSPAMLAVARSLPLTGGAAVAWVKASALALPLPGAAFDVVLCQHGLQQFPDRPGALAEMRRVLVPGGRLAAAVWSRIDDNPGMAALVAALERHVGPAAADNRRVPFALGDAAELTGLLVAAGFSGVRVQTLTETARFPSPEALVDAQLTATPLSTLGALTEEGRLAVVEDVAAALRPYLTGNGLAVPMKAHLAFARS